MNHQEEFLTFKQNMKDIDDRFPIHYVGCGIKLKITEYTVKKVMKENVEEQIKKAKSEMHNL